MKKLVYSAPVTEILSLASMQETMQSASQQATSSSRGYTTAGEYTDSDWE